ncbi:MAG: UDP-N-acetylmuramate dehydrogenase [Patescibacteria group bacterium]
MALIIKEKVSLAPYTTFKLGGLARFYCSVNTEDELVEACQFAREKDLQIFILGGGSNILISGKGFNGLVIRMRIKGITIEEKESGAVCVTAAAGELWDDLVEKTVSEGIYGLENLSAIPGTVGAAPVQNIGAYGAEVSETIIEVRAFHIPTLTFVQLSKAECGFSYRDSVFKHDKGKYVITRVYFGLFKNGKVNTSYREVQQYFAEKEIAEPTLQEVRDAVIDIRWGKLPDWKLWGTAGSFFKNPVISAVAFAELKKRYPDLPGFPEPDDRVKVSLGWILDKVCNVKGLCVGNVCVYEKQALVLVAKPGATSEEVVKLAQDLMKAVKEKTGIDIEGEVEWVN